MIRKSLTIGQVAERTGLSVTSIRFYETEELVFPERNRIGQRRYVPSDIRKLSFVMAAQRLGYSLGDCRAWLGALPKQRAPNARDWAKIAAVMRQDIETRIDQLTRLRDRLDGCIGCGCLSLDTCELYNRDDRAARAGAGPRYVFGDPPKEQA